MGLTIIVPFWNGHAGLPALLNSIPSTIPVVLVNDYGSTPPDTRRWPNVLVQNLNSRGYFSGACNAGFAAAKGNDVLILNQDGALLPGWERALEQRKRYGIIGDGVMGHPAWPNGYVQGTFMFIRRVVLDRVGNFDAELYPLWGATAEFQLRACRKGYQVLPLDAAPYFEHSRGNRGYGRAIRRTLTEEPKRRGLFIRTPPEISVVVTCYNYGRYLAQAVNSVLAQSFQSTEVIIVDDGSTDTTAQVGKELRDPWRGVHYLHQRNQGASAAANRGISTAKGRFVTVLDADDWMAPTRLEKLYRVAVENQHSVICDDVTFVMEQGTKVKRLPKYDFDKLLYQNSMHKGILYPRAAWQEVKGYSLAMTDGREDWEFNIRLGLAGWCGVHLAEPLYMYRRQQQGRTERVPREREYFLEKITRLHPAVYLRGERPMACCGGRRAAPKPSVTVQRTAATPVARASTTLSAAPASDWVTVEYTGASIGNQTIYGPSGTRYKYGRNERFLRLWAHPKDVDFLLETNLFKRYTQPRPARTPAPVPQVAPAPEPAPAPQVVAVEEVPQPQPEPVLVAATAPALALAEEAGVALEDIAHSGAKVTVGDVRTHLDGLGIAH